MIYRWLSFLLAIFVLSACGGSDENSNQAPDSKKTLESRKTPSEKSGQSDKLSSVSQPEKNIEVYEITATTYSAGKVKLWHGAPCLAMNNGLVTSLHKPPYKKVYFLDHEGKQLFIWYPDEEEYPFAQYRMHLPECRKFKKEKYKDCFGLKCNLYLGYRNEQAKEPVLRLVAAEQLSRPPSFELLRTGLITAGAKTGFPLFIETRFIKTQLKRDRTKEWRSVYSTDSLTKKVIPASTFTVPTDYKQVRDLGQFMVGDDLDVEDLFEYKFDKKHRK